MMRRVSLGALLSLCVACWAGGAMGATLNGRFTTSAYSWQVREIDGTVSRHLRLYQALILNARRLGDKPLSFHTYAQVSGDLGDKAPGQRDYRIYHAYLRYHSGGSAGWDVFAGRQRVFAGVGRGTIDGVRLQVAPREEVRLTGYVGMLAPLISDEGIGTWDEGHLWGAQALFNVNKTALGISFAERGRAPIPYGQAGRFTGVRIANSPQQFRRLGMDLRQEVGTRGEIYGRLDLDADETEVQEVELVGHILASPDLRISAEYRHRKPEIHLNSILSVFEVSSNQEVGGRVLFRVNPLISISADASRVIYDDDSSWRVGIGVMAANGYFGYSRRIGYGGENDAFSASIQQPLTPRLTVRANGSLAGYRLYEAQRDRDQALAGSLGLTYRPRRTLSLDVEGQVLRNKFYARDLRIFFRGSVWFFKRGQ